MVGTECQCAFAQVSQTLWTHKQQTVNSSSRTHTLSRKFTCVWYRVPFVLPPTWASRTMKRLLGSLAWYWASCRSMAARRALFVPEEMEKMKSLLNMLRKLIQEALPQEAALCIIENDKNVTYAFKYSMLYLVKNVSRVSFSYRKLMHFLWELTH